MHAASIALPADPAQQRLLRLADTCLILGQRLGEWCGHAPVLEEDIALTNIALDLIGQARALLAHAGTLSGHDEDQLAFLRDERDYLNPTIVELPNGDFAVTVLRNALVATWLRRVWERLADVPTDPPDAELAAIAGKAVKEARYHQQHSADWVVRLGDGTEESHRRLAAALKLLWPYTAELFESDAVDPQAHELHAPWLADIGELLAEAGLAVPAATSFRSTGKRGVHSEHMGHLLAEMQSLQRAFPGGAW
jgi:ring-1,2-phenylacetyl-CoA epoxidase subunit PaaC